MKKETLYLKNTLFYVMLAIFFLPMIQGLFGFMEVKPLKGSIKKSNPVSIEFSTFFSGELQEYLEQLSKEKSGFQPFLIRMNNQWIYSAYHFAKANGVKIGKSNYLYENHYISSYLGYNFIGDSLLDDKVYKLGRIIDTLNKLEVNLFPVFAPGKGSFYPEYFPEEYDTDLSQITKTNYGEYTAKFRDAGIEFLDLRSYFLQMKDTSTYPLFPKTGIHWSKYGEILAADSILKFIENQTHVRMPEIIIDSVISSGDIKYADDDIERAMNLLFDIDDLPMAYPEYTLNYEHLDSLQTVLTVGDSYYWEMFNWGLSKQAFNKGRFWYYFKKVYPDSYKELKMVEDLDLVSELSKNDVVILLCTDANLYHFAFGFIENTYDAFFPNDSSKRGININ